MPVLTFDIESYTVNATQTSSGNGAGWRVIGLTSTSLAHGIRNHAAIYFFDSPPASFGVVTNVDQPNFNGLNVYGYCRKADFVDWYDMLRNESPLRLSCAYDGPDFDANKPSRTLFWVQIYTGQQEPLGEGSEGIATLQFPAAVDQALNRTAAPTDSQDG